MPGTVTNDTSLLTTNRNLEITNLFALVAGGILIKIIFYSQGPANATIWGYTLSAVAVFLLMIISISYMNDGKTDGSADGAGDGKTDENVLDNLIQHGLDNLIQHGLPSLLFFILLLWSIGQSISFFTKINSTILPEEFNMYSFISSFLIIVQAINLYMFFNKQYSIQSMGSNRRLQQKQAEIENMDNTSIMYILTIINSVILGMMQIVLTFFTTDG